VFSGRESAKCGKGSFRHAKTKNLRLNRHAKAAVVPKRLCFHIQLNSYVPFVSLALSAPTAKKGLDALADEMNLSRSELVEQIGRGRLLVVKADSE